MIRTTRASLAAALALPIVLLVSACGGATATQPPAGAATPTPAPVAATPTPVPVAGAVTPAPVAGSFDLSQIDFSKLGGAIPGLDSYKVTVSTNGTVEYDSVVVTKPVLAKAITTYDGATVGSRFIIIGQDAWQADGAAGTFTPVPSVLASTLLLAMDPATLLSVYSSLDLGKLATDAGSETKNGVQARHLKLDGALLGQAGAQIDIWIADAGYLVGLETTGGSDTLAIEVTNVNDPGNKVEKPS